MAAPEPDSLETAVAWLARRFDPEAARGLSVVYQLDLDGPHGGSFHLVVDDGRLRPGMGPAASPAVRLRLADRDYFAVLAGRENPDVLYMAGRLEIEGDLTLALKLRTLFGGR